MYIAASSREIPRVERAVEAIEAHNRQHPEAAITITHEWHKIIRERGDANPVDAPFHERARYAQEDLVGVREADYLWLMMPVNNGIGCFWEAGYADALGVDIVISGPQLERSIFTARGCCYSDDESALNYLFDTAFLEFDCATAAGV